MSMSVKLTISLLFFAAAANAAGILDFLDNEGAGGKMIEVPELREDQPNRNCLCKGPACVCCVDFNITLVDIGGPGCVHMKYLSADEGFSVKVSYGKNLIHSSKIKGTNPDPICLQVFGKFAQVCAKFSDLAPTADGLRGCLELEPRLLGDPQLEFPIGCFKSTNGGMEMEEPPAKPEEEAEEETAEGDDNENGFDAEALIASMVQTAEQGVAFLSSLLDLPRLNSTRPLSKPTTTVKPEESQSTETSTAASRSARTFKHINLL